MRIFIFHQTLTCEWDGQWTATDTLMSCVWTHCIDPPTADPVNVTQLEPVWDGNLVDFDQAWLPDGCIRIFRNVCVWAFGLLDYSSATLRCKI